MSGTPIAGAAGAASRPRVAVFGAGHLGRQLAHYLRHHGGVELVGFVDDTRPAGQPVTDDLHTLGGLADLGAAPQRGPRDMALAFAIGYADMAARRAALERVRASGWPLHSFVHPRAFVEPGVDLGEGSIVLADAVLDQQVRVGAGCYIDIGVRLTSGTTVGCNNWFSAGTSTGSRVTIGDDCFFGMDCTVVTDVRMGSRLFVNAKTLVPRDVGDDLKLVELHKSAQLPLPRR